MSCVEVRWTERPGHGVALTREALMGGAKVVVCVGGDGTLAEVVVCVGGDGTLAEARSDAKVVVCVGGDGTLAEEMPEFPLPYP
ncbi:hypothetical protein T484DRAFT_1800410 [Baffinella frigidus]|nr:hypothetical protein T484DRAFT_1800410 [Cryptophyta sp. CCMP2293]